jgi:hypothetical protein
VGALGLGEAGLPAEEWIGKAETVEVLVESATQEGGVIDYRLLHTQSHQLNKIGSASTKEHEN